MIAIKIDINQIGMIVFFLKPTPNSFIVPSGLYIKAGLTKLTSVNKIIYKIIATDTLLCLTHRGFII